MTDDLKRQWVAYVIREGNTLHAHRDCLPLLLLVLGCLVLYLMGVV